MSNTPRVIAARPQGRALPWVLGMVAVLGMLLLAGLKWGPHQMRHLLAERATEALGRQVSARGIDVALLSGTLTVSDLKIDSKDPGKPMLEVARVRLALEPWTYLAGTMVVRSIELDAPKVRLVRIAPDRLDLSDVIERFTNRPPSLRKTEWRINRIELRDGSVELDDRVVNKATRIESLQAKIAGLSNQEGKEAQPATLDLRFALDGRPTVIEGQADLFGASPEGQGRAQLDALPLAAVQAYLSLPNDVRLADGSISLDLKARFSRNPPALSDRLQLEGSAALKGLSVRDGAGVERLSLGSAVLELAPSHPVGGEVHVARLALVEPRMISGRSRDGAMSWPMLQATSATSASAAAPGNAMTASPAQDSASRAPRALKIDALSIESGRVDWLDEGLSPGLALRADAITVMAAPIAIADLTQAASIRGQIKASATVDDSAPVQAEVTLEGTSGQATVSLDKVELGRYARLASSVLKAKIDRGWAQAQAVVRWDTAASSWSVQDASASLNDVRVTQDARTPVAFAKLTASGVKVDPATHRIDIASVGLDKASVAARRNREGRIDLQDLIVSSEPAAPTRTGSSNPAAARPWALSVNEAAVRQLDLDYRDALIPRDQALPRVRVDARAVNLSLDPSKPIPFDATVALADGSRVQARGTARPTPMQLDTQLTLSRVALSYLDPYIEPYLNLTLARGQLSGGGRLQVNGTASDAVNRIGFTGELSVNNFDTQDKVTREDFLRWSALAVPSIKVDWKPADIAGSRIEIGQVALVDFYSRVILAPDGRLNLSQILIDPDKQTAPVSITTAASQPGAAPAAMGADRRVAPQPERATDRPRPSVVLGPVQIANGNVNFTDLFIRPNYTANLTQLTGSIEAISSDRPEPAEVRITGRVDDDTPLEITGRINPLAPTTQLDLQAVARGFDLPRLSPYSGRWTGYAIEKGKLTANVRYRIEGQQLQAENKLIINQLTFGQAVDSPDATKLPVRLAVSLLKDRNGNIDLDLPISGTVTDPQFSVGGLIWRALGNLIMRVVTSPFALLSSVAGGGETADLSHLEFTAGKASLDEDDQRRLDTLVDAMTQRPGVSLEIAGFGDPVGDRDQLRHQRLERSLKSARLAEIRRTDRTSALPSVDEVTLSPQERVVLLEQMWRAEKLSAGTKGEAPLPEEMEKLLLARIPIDEQDLLQLAQRRADAAHDYLRGKGVPDEHIFVLSPKLAQSGDSQPAARVSFSVR